MRRKQGWLLAAGVGIGALLLTSKARQSPTEASSDDVDNLARMLIAETSFGRDPAEMSQIVQVAINRATGRGKTLSEVVVPPGQPVWNSGPEYARRFWAASSNPRFQAARAFVLEVLGGRWPNLIGGRRMFVHPSGMPTPPCASNRVAASTSAGTRCLPEWVLNGKQVGGALFA